MPRRRIVTGVNEHGQSIIVADGPAPTRIALGSFDWEELWAADSLPAPLDEASDPGVVERVYTMRPGAMLRACIMALPPEAERRAPPATDVDRAEFARRVDVNTGVTRLPENPRMHRTPTLDIIVVLSGEMDMELDGGQVVRLQPGDSVIQRGTMHAWRVVGDAPCVFAAFMVPGEVRERTP